MNSNKGDRRGQSSFFRPLSFSFVVNKPPDTCVEMLQRRHELHVVGSSHHVKVQAVNDKVQRFSVDQPRRVIAIRAVGYLTEISESSTEISGQVNADYVLLGLGVIVGLLVMIFAISSGDSGAICFGPLIVLILAIGLAIELVGQYYAKLGMFTFIKQSFETNV